jgi:hypothetical protein
VKFSVIDHKDGTYDLQYNSTIARDVVTLHLTFNNQDLVASPFIVVVSPGGPNAAKSKV